MHDLSEQPITWREKLSAVDRIRHAVSVPVLVGVAIFVAAVLIAVFIAWSKSGTAEEWIGQTDSASDMVTPLASIDSLDNAADGSDTGAADADNLTVVHIVGEVAKPGVYELATGARVQDAILAAGGETKAAVLSGINLARQLVDGEQIVVPDAKAAKAAAKASGGSSTAAPDAGATGSTSIINLNQADKTALESLPRVGPALAQRIIDWREQHGGFSSVEQLLSVSGIGPKTLAGFRDQVTV